MCMCERERERENDKKKEKERDKWLFKPLKYFKIVAFRDPYVQNIEEILCVTLNKEMKIAWNVIDYNK